MVAGLNGVSQAIRSHNIIGEEIGADSTVDRLRPAVGGLRGDIVENPVRKHHVCSLVTVHDRPFKKQGLLGGRWESSNAVNKRFEA
jgi:hypothetical protein